VLKICAVGLKPVLQKLISVFTHRYVDSVVMEDVSVRQCTRVGTLIVATIYLQLIRN